MTTPSGARPPATIFLLALGAAIASAQAPQPTPARHNVILFVADGLRRNSVTPEDMPTLFRLRSQGTDFRNSHAVFPTFTTANASVIATGHGLGDTGDFSNTIYPGFYLTDHITSRDTDGIAPFLEDDNVLATLNGSFNGNYLGETPLLTAAHDAGFNVASIGKLGPVAIQLAASVNRDPQGHILPPAAIIVDDYTGLSKDHTGIPLPLDLLSAFEKGSTGIATTAPDRSNGHPSDDPSDRIWNNGFSGTAEVPGTLAANITQEKWFADVATRVVLPTFAASGKPFVLLFWSRDPDGTQHNQGDSLQTLSPGIDGPTTRLALRNADHCLAELLDWLDRHPAVKATTDILVTSDHGFATISRKQIDAAGNNVVAASNSRQYTPVGSDAPEPPDILPTGFLAIDLAIHGNYRLFDANKRASAGDSPYLEIPLGEPSLYPSKGSALLAHTLTQLDGSDASLIVAANGGSDLIYVPSKNPAIVKDTIALLSELPYVNGIFADDDFCPKDDSCPGALPLHAIGLKGATKLPTPAIVVNFTTFYLKPTTDPDHLQSAIQVADTTLQEGQGMHGGFGRDQTWNNMAAIGPDFKLAFVDNAPVGNIDITPTIASILGLQMPSHGTLKGRILSEALTTGPTPTPAPAKTLASSPSANGRRTVLDYQESNGVRYLDRGCMTANAAAKPVCD
jgi:hypothetical protein